MFLIFAGGNHKPRRKNDLHRTVHPQRPQHHRNPNQRTPRHQTPR